jgi:hypothetical protein
MFNRRKLFGFAVAAPAVAFLPNNHVKADVTKEDISHNAPNGTNILQLQAQEMKPVKASNPYTITMTSFQPTGPVLGISVGKDGHMWVRINEKWKRVVVE